VGDYSVILDSNDGAVCIIKTIKVDIVEFNKVSAEHAYKEGEGDRSLAYWREVHSEFLTNELASIHRAFDESARVVCEEFEVVYKYAQDSEMQNERPPIRDSLMGGRFRWC
jgi:uncharacterized protein YhfF